MAAQVSLSTFKNVLKLFRREALSFQLHRPRQLLDCKAILDTQLNLVCSDFDRFENPSLIINILAHSRMRYSVNYSFQISDTAEYDIREDSECSLHAYMIQDIMIQEEIFGTNFTALNQTKLG